MNKKLVFNVTSKILIFLSFILLLPMLIAIIYKEKSFFAFLLTAIISLVIGTVTKVFTKNYSKSLYAKEGFAIVALAWVCTSVIGALPFVLSGEVTNPIDAFFESVSGFTTTGASVLSNIEELSHGLLFWRSFSHWIGGMGVLVFMIAFVSNISDRSMHILRAEMPGPIVGKLTPRAKDTSKVLYIMYLALTVVQIILLWLGEMDLFESILHALGSAGTGGFGVKADSIASYSPYSQWIISIFILMFGVNFNLYYLLMIKRFKIALKSGEFWTYLSIIAVSTILITANVSPLYNSISTSVRHSFFQVTSIITTTGFASVDFDLWPAFSKSVLFILMFIGGCAGSTAGGFKVTRIIIIFKMILKQIRSLVHPRSVSSVNFEGKELDEHTQSSVTSYLAIYTVSLFLIYLVISLEPFSFETNFSAVISCFNNVGPGFAGVGPMMSYSEYSSFSKLILSFTMLLGRLEVFPLIIALIPSTWKKKV